MTALLAADVPPDLSWMRPPLLNSGTRLAATMRAADGALELAGFEGERRVSEILRTPR